SFLKVCHRSDPKLNECVQDALEELRPHLVKGIPELDIPSCEPLELKEMVLDQGKGAVSLKSTYKNIKVYGSTKFQLRNIRIDIDKKRVRMKMRFPLLRMSSQYNMDGRILMMPIKGNGNSEGNYTGIEATITIQGEHIKRNGQIHFSVKDFDLKFSIGHATVYLDNLFNGDRELGEAMNAFLNENWDTVVMEVKPLLEKKIGEICKKYSNNIFHKYTFDQLLPP
ncbi:hypothetical protein ANN_09902, partial [Periplaneta americana]